MFHTQCLVKEDTMCVVIRETSLPTIIRFLSMSPFSHIYRRFHVLYSPIHIPLPDSPQINLM